MFDVVTAKTNSEGTIIYANGEVAGKISPMNTTETQAERAGWLYLGSDSVEWTEKYAATTTIVAAGIAAALMEAEVALGNPFLITAARVATAMGTAALGVYVNKMVDAMIYMDFYQQTSFGQTTLRIDWSIDFEGEVSDTYSLFIPVGPITVRDVDLAE